MVPLSGEFPHTNLGISEELLHGELFGVAHTAHPLDALAGGEPCDLREKSHAGSGH